jgi:hypothetical protein
MAEGTTKNGVGTLLKTAGIAAVLVAVQVIGVTDALAQQPPPIQGVTGTIATETSIEETTAAGHGILAKIKRVLHLNGGNTVPNGDAAGEEALAGLKKGTRVVVRTAADGTNLTAGAIDRHGREGLKEMSGSVVAVTLGERTISVKLSDDSIQTLRLSEDAAANAKDIDRAGDTGANVIVYYRNESGQRVAKYFTRIP